MATINEIRKAHSSEKAASDRRYLWLFLVARRVSFYLTWFFIKLGISANQVTYLSIVCVCLGCLLLATGSYYYVILGSILVNLWFILDCVDGNIARYHRSPSKYGQFVDGIGADITEAFLFTSIGIGVYFNPNRSFEKLLSLFLSDSFGPIDKGIYLIFGSLTSLTIILRRLIGQRLIAIMPRKDEFIEREIEIKKPLKSKYPALFFIYGNLTGLSGLTLPALIFVAYFKVFDSFVILYFLIYTSVFILNLARYILWARKYVDR